MNRYEKRKLKTRQQLKDATLQLILEQGYEGVVIQDITDRADLGRGTFYVHYRDKEEIVWEIFQDGFLPLRDLVLAHIDGIAKNAVPLFSLTVIFNFILQNRDIVQLVLGPRSHAPLADRFAEYLADSFLQIRQEERIALEIDLPDVFVAQFLSGAVTRVMGWALQAEDDPDPLLLSMMFYQMMYRREPPPEVIERARAYLSSQV